MRAVYIARTGGPEVLEVRQSPDPEPGPGQVRIRVKAAGVNFADILMRMGLYPGAPKTPFVPGYEAAGIVDKAGDGAREIGEGTSVVAPVNYGGYADTLIVPAGDVFPIPRGKSFSAGAALTVNYLTAYEALLEQGHLQKGRRILIHGAAGGVGIAAIQLSRIFKAEVFGTASPSKHDVLRKLGVRPIDYNKEDFEARIKEWTNGRGVDLVLDPVGGVNFKKSYRCLAPGGKLVLYGFSAAAAGPQRSWLRLLWHGLRTPRFSAFDLMSANKGVVGIHLGRMTGEKARLRLHMAQLVEWWAQGELEPMVGASFPLELAPSAHEFIQDRRNIGKVVLLGAP